MLIGSFGTQILFEVSPEKVLTPRSVKREVAAKYEKHAVLGAKERLEFLHPHATKFSLEVTLSAMLGVTPRKTANTVQEVVEQGVFEKLILGGVNYGTFVITKMTETWSKTDPHGQELTITMQLELEEYVP